VTRGQPAVVTIRCRHLLPMRGDPIGDCWIRIAAGRIIAVGRGRPPAADAVDPGDAIVVPGLVNAHTHLEFSASREPLDAAGGLPGWIGRVVRLRREREAAPDSGARVEAAIEAGLLESCRAGVTAIGEIATALPAGAYAGCGPRVRVFREAIGLSAAAAAAALRTVGGDLDRLAARHTPAGLSPHAPYSVSARLASACIAEARRRRLPVAMHLAESLAEEELLTAGTGPFRTLLEGLGAWQTSAPPRLLSAAEWISRLAKAPRGMVVHGTHLGRNEDAMARLARHRDRLCVAVCPRTTRALSGVLPPVALFRAAGVRVALGTDSRASNPDLSVLAECRTLVDAGVVAPPEALRMATVHGAWALALEHRCGILVPGRPADLVVLRPAARHRDPYDAVLDPATAILATLRAGRVIAGAVTAA